MSAVIDWNHRDVVLIDPHYHDAHFNGIAILDIRHAISIRVEQSTFTCDQDIPLAHVTYSDSDPPIGYPIIEVLGVGEFVNCTFTNVFVWTSFRNKPPGGRVRARLWMHRRRNYFRKGARWIVLK